MYECEIHVVLLHAHAAATAATLSRGGYVVHPTADRNAALRMLVADESLACVVDLPMLDAGQFLQSLRRAGIDARRVVVMSMFVSAFDVIGWRGRVISPRDGEDELISSVDRACASALDGPRSFERTLEQASATLLAASAIGNNRFTGFSGLA